MKKITAIFFTVIFLVMGLGAGIVSANEPTSQTGEAKVTVASIGILAAMPLDGSWTILDEHMDEGDFFSGSWMWTSANPVTFTITDLYVVTDEFEVYDNGVLVLTTPSLPDYSELVPPIGAFDTPPWTSDPDTALAEPLFSKGIISFGPGSHEITIIDIDIPLGFSDGTVAFKAELVVEIDIKPGSCPNPFNSKSMGSVPVAIVGTADFDVETVDPATICLVTPWGEVVCALENWEIVDSTEPFDGDPADCFDCFDAEENFNFDADGDGVFDTYIGDGYPDLVVKFDTQELAATDAIADAKRGDCVELMLMGNTYGGIPITFGSDSVLKRK